MGDDYTELKNWLRSRNLEDLFDGIHNVAGISHPTELLELALNDIYELSNGLELNVLSRRRFIRAIQTLNPDFVLRTDEQSIGAILNSEEKTAIKNVNKAIGIAKRGADYNFVASVDIERAFNRAEMQIQLNFEQALQQVKAYQDTVLKEIAQEGEEALEKIRKAQILNTAAVEYLERQADEYKDGECSFQPTPFYATSKSNTTPKFLAEIDKNVLDLLTADSLVEVDHGYDLAFRDCLDYDVEDISLYKASCQATSASQLAGFKLQASLDGAKFRRSFSLPSEFEQEMKQGICDSKVGVNAEIVWTVIEAPPGYSGPIQIDQIMIIETFVGILDQRERTLKLRGKGFPTNPYALSQHNLSLLFSNNKYHNTLKGKIQTSDTNTIDTLEFSRQFYREEILDGVKNTLHGQYVSSDCLCLIVEYTTGFADKVPKREEGCCIC